MLEIYRINLSFLVAKMEKEFSVKINDFGVVGKGHTIYNRFETERVKCEYIGYVVVPVDEDGEFLVTSNLSNVDESSFIGKINMNNAIIETENLRAFMQREFQCRVFYSNLISFLYAPNKENIPHNMTEDDHFVYLYYYIL